MTTVNPLSDSLLTSMNGGRASQAGAIQEAQDRFMTLLVTQMKNQDPLNPLDNAEVTSQMAQLSTVTGIEKMNATLEGLIGSLQATQVTQASSLIGRTVMVESDALYLNDGQGYFGVDLPLGADQLSVTIRDADGRAVRQLELGAQPAGLLDLQWNGYGDDGSQLPAGRYRFEASARIGDSGVAATPLGYEQVVSVSSGSGGVKLNLTSQRAVGTGDIRQIF